MAADLPEFLKKRFVEITEGEFAGYRSPQGSYAGQSGPFYLGHDEDGTPVAAFRVEEHHLNFGGFVHGGCLMTFADMAAFHIARDALDGGRAVTLTMNCDFMGRGKLGQRIECRGEVRKSGRSAIFVDGLITADGVNCFQFTAVLHRVALPTPTDS